jgi:hypothetical protein
MTVAKSVPDIPPGISKSDRRSCISPLKSRDTRSPFEPLLAVRMLYSSFWASNPEMTARIFGSSSTTRMVFLFSLGLSAFAFSLFSAESGGADEGRARWGNFLYCPTRMGNQV